jgi:hypothetical protein
MCLTFGFYQFYKQNSFLQEKAHSGLYEMNGQVKNFLPSLQLTGRPMWERFEYIPAVL